MNKLDNAVIGFDSLFRVGITLFSPKPIKTEEELLKLKEHMGNLQNTISELIYNELKSTELDSVTTELLTVDYLTPDDIDVEIDVIEI